MLTDIDTKHVENDNSIPKAKLLMIKICFLPTLIPRCLNNIIYNELKEWL